MIVKHGVKCDCCPPYTEEDRKRDYELFKKSLNPSIKDLKNKVKFLKKQIRNSNKTPSRIVLNNTNDESFAIVFINGYFYKFKNKCDTHGMSIPVPLVLLMRSDFVVDQTGVVHKTLPGIAEAFERYFNNNSNFMKEHVKDLSDKTREEVFEILNKDSKDTRFILDFIESVGKINEDAR